METLSSLLFQKQNNIAFILDGKQQRNSIIHQDLFWCPLVVLLPANTADLRPLTLFICSSPIKENFPETHLVFLKVLKVVLKICLGLNGNKT